MIVALMPTLITTIVRSIMFLRYGVSLNGFDESVKHLVFSVISIAGIAYNGKLPSKPRQYSSWTLEVRLSCGKFIVTISSILFPNAS